MATIGAELLVKKYGSPLAVAEALLKGEVGSHEQKFVNEVVSPIILQAAAIRLGLVGQSDR